MNNQNKKELIICDVVCDEQLKTTTNTCFDSNFKVVLA